MSHPLLVCLHGVHGEDITVSYASLGAAYMDHVVAIEKATRWKKVLYQGSQIRWRFGDPGLIVRAIHFSSSAGSL